MTATAGLTGTAESVVRAYYGALRTGAPLAPFFADGEDVVKVGISERLVGSEAVEAALREQTSKTEHWTVGSHDLHVTDRGCHGWFADRVTMAWTDTERDRQYEFDSRWSGTLERRADGTPTADEDAQWRFVGMHVSAGGEL